MTVVNGRVGRAVVPDDLFVEITTAPVVNVGRTSITFDGDLTSEQVEAVQWVMAARSDADQSARDNLRDLCAALDPEDPTAAAVCAVIDYLLTP